MAPPSVLGVRIWHDSDVPARPRRGRYLGKSRRNADIAFP